MRTCRAQVLKCAFVEFAASEHQEETDAAKEALAAEGGDVAVTKRPPNNAPLAPKAAAPSGKAAVPRLSNAAVKRKKLKDSQTGLRMNMQEWINFVKSLQWAEDPYLNQAIASRVEPLAS